MTEFKAILKYPGGKWRIADWIISHFPPHKVYCEPFLGSGAVFFTKRPAMIETINDINGEIVNLFKVCRERPGELAAALKFTPWAREEYVNCKETRATKLNVRGGCLYVITSPSGRQTVVLVRGETVRHITVRAVLCSGRSCLKRSCSCAPD